MFTHLCLCASSLSLRRLDLAQSITGIVSSAMLMDSFMQSISEFDQRTHTGSIGVHQCQHTGPFILQLFVFFPFFYCNTNTQPSSSAFCTLNMGNFSLLITFGNKTDCTGRK